MKTVVPVILVILFFVVINYFTGCGGIVSCASDRQSAISPVHCTLAA
jgi:hypothetical protein